MPRMRNSLGQRIDPRTGQPYDPESRPVPQHARSDPGAQPNAGLEEHFLRSDFRRAAGAVIPSPVSSRASPRNNTSEADTAQGPPRDDPPPPPLHRPPPLPWLTEEATFATDTGSQISTSIRRTFEAYQDPRGWAWRFLSRAAIDFYWQQFQVSLFTTLFD
jgi:hypothetical protein